MDIFNYFNFSFLLGGITCYSTAIWIYFKNRHNSINKSWFLLGLSAGTWSINHFLMSITRSYQMAWIFCYVLYGAAIFIPSFYMYFIFSLLGETKRRRKEIVFSFLMSFVFLILMPTKLFLQGVSPKFMFNYYDTLGSLAVFFILFFVIIPVYSLYRLFLALRNQSRIKSLQLKYVALASIFGFLGGGGSFFLAFNISFPPYFLILFVFYPLIITYAILKYRLMNITVVVTRTGVFVVVYTLVLGLPFFLAVLGRTWLIRFLGNNWWIGPLVLMAVLATVGPFLYIFLQRKTEAILLYEQRKYQQALNRLANEITRIHSLKKLLDLIANVFVNTVGVIHFGAYILDENSSSFLLKSGRNLKKGFPYSIKSKNVLINWLRQEREIAVYEEIKRKSQDDPDSIFEELTKEMRSLGASVLIPCFFEGKLTIIISLGDKLSKKAYTSQDLNIFSILSGQIALAIEDASLYENMEEQVKQRTKELVEVQKQLIQTEKLATIGTLAGGVAHEINNPLTAILINVQMLIASGKIIQDEDDKESLELIRNSTKRCQSIVQKLMTYARRPIKEAEITPINIMEVINNVVSFLSYQLKQENIKISVNCAKDNLSIKGNRNELEQVITNIILNAKDAIERKKGSGNITITVFIKGDWVKTEIEDDGGGIEEGVISNIFDPFFTTKDIGKGLGLGLSICQAIVERYNGSITVNSKLGKGSVFTVQLPLYKREEISKKIKSY